MIALCPMCDEPLPPREFPKGRKRKICKSKECLRLYHLSYGIDRRKREGRQTKGDMAAALERRNEEMRVMRAAGAHLKEIAAKFDLHHAYVSWLLSGVHCEKRARAML